VPSNSLSVMSKLRSCVNVRGEPRIIVEYSDGKVTNAALNDDGAEVADFGRSRIQL